MDHVVQQNASLVEEAAAATESMKGEAAGLQQLVARFRVAAGEAQPASAPVAPIRYRVAERSEAPKASAPRLGAPGAQEWRSF